MQALILGCLLCLQISNPCDSNQAQPISQDPSCTKCLADLRDHFQFPPPKQILTNATSPTVLPPASVQTETSPENTNVIVDLLADVEDIVQRLKENPNEVYDLVNKIGTEIRQGLVPEVQVQGNKLNHQLNEGTIQRVQKQELLLEKITEKFKSFFHHVEEILNKLSSMKKTLLNEDVLTEGNQEESIVKRDSIMSGERLMAGEYLISKNGEYKFVLSLTTGESIISDRQGTVLKTEVTCSFPKPTPATLHMYMGESLEYYLDIWNGKSANQRCATSIPMDCVEKDSKCFVKLDNDGYLKMCKKSGEPVFTLF